MDTNFTNWHELRINRRGDACGCNSVSRTLSPFTAPPPLRSVQISVIRVSRRTTYLFAIAACLAIRFSTPALMLAIPWALSLRFVFLGAGAAEAAGAAPLTFAHLTF